LMNITIVFRLYKVLKTIVSIMAMWTQKENGILIGFQAVKKFVTNVSQVIILIMNMNAQNYHQIVIKLTNMVFVRIVQMDNTNLTQLTIVFQYQLVVMMIIVSNTVTLMLKELFTWNGILVVIESVEHVLMVIILITNIVVLPYRLDVIMLIKTELV
jgi:hypothetical protein